MDKKNDWENLVNPIVLKDNLIASALYLCSYEILKNAIVDEIKSFFANEYDKEAKPVESQEYKAEVRALDKNIFTASLLWLKKMKVISEDDITKFPILKSQRDKIAHNMINVLSSQKAPVHRAYFTDAVELLNKIQKWWIVNVEIPSDPQFDRQDIKEYQVMPGSVVMLKHLQELAFEYKE